MWKPFSDLTTIVYRYGLKPTYFAFDAEHIHDLHINAGVTLGELPPTRFLINQLWAYQNPKLGRTLDGIYFPNPVGLAAGFDYNANLTQLVPALGFGFHSIGTVTWHPYEGNTKPRLGRFPQSQALLVNKGLKNDGVPAIIKKLQSKKLHIPTGISVASTNQGYKNDQAQIDDMLHSFRALEKSHLEHAYYELNISCPNTFGGEPFTTAPRLELLLKAIDKLNLGHPLYIKMPIDQSDEETIKLIKVITKHNTQGLIIGNLTKNKKNPSVHPHDRAAWQTRPGNLSGKPTWKRSNHLISLARKQTKQRFTIIGTGGVFSGEDALTKLNHGADLIQLITGMIYQGPQLIGQINHHLARHL